MTPTMNAFSLMIIVMTLQLLHTSKSQDLASPTLSVVLNATTAFAEIQWLGNTENMAVALTSDGRLFSTRDGAQHWRVHDGDLPLPISTLVASTVPPFAVYALDSDVSAWFSADFGQSFRRAADRILSVEFNTHFPDSNQIAELRASAGCGLARISGEACFTELFLSTDAGRTFKLLLTYVEKVRFSAKHRDSIFVSTFLDRRGAQRVKSPTDNVLLRLDNIGAPNDIAINVIAHGVAAFLHTGDYFLVARYTNALSINSVVMLVSRDDHLFDVVQFRGNVQPLQFTVLVATNASLVIAAYQSPATSIDPLHSRYGQLYASDATGTRMKLVHSHIARSATHTYDFTAIDVAHGIYAINEIAAWSNRSSVTDLTTPIVTLDGGSTWQPVKMPIESMVLVHRDSDERSVFATTNAPGVVFATGRYPGSAPEAIVSLDFGLSWHELKSPDVSTAAEVHLIPGLSLVIAVGDLSSDRLAWTRITGNVDNGTDPFTTVGSVSFWTRAWPGNATLTDVNFYVPRVNAARVALAVAQINGVYVLVRVGFDEITVPQCADADLGVFSLVAPDGSKCALGRELAVRRLLASAPVCSFDGVNISTLYVETPCECTLNDFQCDVGYESTTNTPPCTLVVDTPPRDCLAPASYNRTSVRRVPGNLCVLSNGTDALGLQAPAEVECPAKFVCDCGSASKNGDCIAHGVCRCDEGWAGRQCNEPLFECQNSSCVHGTCSNVIHCECEDGFSGLDCSAQNLPPGTDIDPREVRGPGLSGVEIFFIVAGVVAGLSLLIGFIAMIYLRFYGGRRFLHLREEEGTSNREPS